MSSFSPFISVIISTYNRQDYIITCLECLAAQTLPPDKFEVIIVDNHCTDNTAALVKNFIAQNPSLPFRYVYEGQKGLSYARNKGIKESAGSINVFLDDDAEAVPVLLQTYFDFFENNKQAAGAGGKILPKYSEAPRPKWMNEWLNGFVGKIDLGGSTRVFTGKMKYPIGCNMAYRKSILEQVGGFDNALEFRGDDKNIFYNVKKVNALIYYLPEAWVYHNIPGGRLQFAYFKTLFLKTGNEEKQRVKLSGSFFFLIIKFFEFLFKLGVSIGIWLLYAITSRELQGRYVFYSQWFTLKGFLMGKVFVR